MGSKDLPNFDSSEYGIRVDKLREKMKNANITHVVIFGDEYYYDNLFYLCGYRPIFEMATLVVRLENPSILITGHEGKSLALQQSKNCDVHIFGPFSVQGMQYSEKEMLSQLFSMTGMKDNASVGVIGPRYFTDGECENADFQHSVPSIIINSIQKNIGRQKPIPNVTAWLTHITEGIRSVKSAAEIAALEEAGTIASRGVASMLEVVSPGMKEIELLGIAQAAAPSPLYSYPPIVHSGKESCNTGLVVSTRRRIQQGEPVVIYYSPSYHGYSGNCGRSGILIVDGNGVNFHLYKEMTQLFYGTFQSYLYLLQNIHINANAREVINQANKMLEKEGLKQFYTPIHSTGLTEWENGFDREEGEIKFMAGQVLQLDYTIFSQGFPLCPAKIEDGIAIVDEHLRNELKRYTVQWNRINQRQAALGRKGICLDDSVLPLSDLIGQFYPILPSSKYVRLTSS